MKQQLGKVEGVESVEVDFGKKTALIKGKNVKAKALLEALKPKYEGKQIKP